MSEEPELLLQSNRFRVVRHRQRTADGSFYTRDTVQHPGAVGILPILEDGRVCLIRNYRVAVGDTLIEIPAGTLDREENPADAARRELQEETGFTAAEIRPLTQCLMSPGILHERMYLFLATGLTPGPSALEAGEQIQTLIVPWDAALEMIGSGRIQDAKTVAALLFYQQFHRSHADR